MSSAFPAFYVKPFLRAAAVVTTSVLLLGAAPNAAQAQMTAFKQAVAETASDDRDLAAFYRDQVFTGMWTGSDAQSMARRQALITALSNVGAQGLPEGRYDLNGLLAQMRSARTPRDLGMVEVAMSKAYLQYARDVQFGVLNPKKAAVGIERKALSKPALDYLTELKTSDPAAVIAKLPPQTPEYPRLRKEMLRLQDIVARGGWGPTVPGKKYEPGDTGNNVVKLRNRLIALGYLPRSATRSYDAAMTSAVQQFQVDHGLESDGVAGSSTIAELNVSAEHRLKSILVAMERERWTNFARGERHIWVNLTDYTAKIVDDGKVTFRTRSVVGQNVSDRRSPEFSDTMEHMIINPTWNVPRSIAVKEYLPMMKKNPAAAGHLNLLDGRGRVVSRANIDFSQFTAKNFPFDMKQPPSSRNALGLVKFMFPNRHNIYLHDTPAKNLFSRETRAYSHGCIRLHQPFDFAYALLAVQSEDPKGEFQRILKTGRETQIDLQSHVPVHIVYRTAVVPAKGKANYRRDVYGRDAQVWKSMERAGVVLRPVQS